MKRALLLPAACALPGCVLEPSPADIALARNRDACHAACDLTHQACLINPPGLCTLPCSHRFLSCRMRCPPGPVVLRSVYPRDPFAAAQP